MTKLDNHNANALTHSVYFVTKREGTANPDWIKVGLGSVHQDKEWDGPV